MDSNTAELNNYINEFTDLARTLAGEWLTMGPYGRLHPFRFFRLLWRVYCLLAAGRFAYPLREYVHSNFLPEIDGRSIPAIRETDKLNPRNRYALILMTTRLLVDWPDRFVSACATLGIRARHIYKDRSNEPFALVDPIERIPVGTPPKANSLHIEEIKKHLSARKIAPTQRSIRELSGRKPRSLSTVAEPAINHIPYGQSRFWKLDRVSPAIRQSAKEAAKKEGEKIAAWVELAISEKLAREKKRIDTSIRCNIEDYGN